MLKFEVAPAYTNTVSREQYKGKHDVVNDEGFAMHCRANTAHHLEIFRCERINTAKQKGWTDFSYIDCFRSEDLSIWFSRRTLGVRK